MFCAALVGFFFCKQKTEYGVRISDWSSDVCSSDLTDRGWHGARTLQAPGCRAVARLDVQGGFGARRLPERRRPARCLPVCGCATTHDAAEKIGSESCRERVCQYV